MNEKKYGLKELEEIHESKEFEKYIKKELQGNWNVMHGSYLIIKYLKEKQK